MYIRTYPKRRRGRKYDVGGFLDSKQTAQPQQQQQQVVQSQNQIQQPQLDPLSSNANANDYLSAIPLVGTISGAVGSIVDPIEQDMKEVDPLTGKYKSHHDAYTADVNRSFFDPLTTGTRALDDDGASTGEKIGSFLGFGAAWSKDRTNRQEKENIEKVSEYKKDVLRQDRLANLDQSNQKNYGSSFGNGGMIKSFPDGGPLYSPQANTKDVVYSSDLDALRAHKAMGINEPMITDPVTYQTSKLNKNQTGLANVPGVTKESFNRYNNKLRPHMTREAYDAFEAARAFGTNKAKPVTPKGNGGQLEGANNNDNITYFGNGGTHQENKFGGIPLGNTGNSVEQGEIRFNDYIFSDRF